jgi:hypothetical protein
LSSATLNIALQTDFVRTELETGRRMLGLAAQQRSLQDHEAAMQSFNMACVALTGAERHLALAKLPLAATREVVPQVRELRQQIAAFEGGRPGQTPCTARRAGRKRVKKVHSGSAA